MKTRFSMLATLVILAAAFAVSAQELAPREVSDQPQRPNRLAALLGLTDEQRMQFRRINQQTRTKLRNAQQQFRIARRQLDEAIYGENTSDELVRERTAAVIAAQAEITKAQTLREYEVRKVLTPEQLKRFVKLRKRSAERRRKGRPGFNRRMMQRRNGSQRPRQDQPPPVQ